MGVLKVMDHSGDTVHTFDPANAAEVDKAMAVFNEFVGGKGFTAYKRGQDGKPNELLRSFDGQADEIVLRPRLVGG